MNKITGGEAVIRSLIANNTDVIFGLPGAQLDPMFAALHDYQDEIKIIHSRHEQGCAYMAYGYGEATGRTGTFMVVPGPGLLNAGAAISTGYACNTPMLCIAGQGASHLIGKQLGYLHEIPDQLAVAKGLVKWADKISHPAHVPAKIKEGLEKIREGRTRPVYLELPFDLARLEAAVPDMLVADQTARYPIVDQEHIDAAAKVLANAKCPLIMIGGGSKEAGSEVKRLAEKLNAPVTMTQNGLGTLDSRHPLAFTQVGGHHWWGKADVVLALGTRLHPAVMMWGRDKGMKIIKVDVDAEELNRLPGPIDGIQGDIETVAKMLDQSVEQYLPAKVSDRESEIQAVRGAIETELEKIAPQRELLNVIRQEIGENGVMVFDLTQLYFAGQDTLPIYKPRTFIHPSYQGTLGHAAATVLGVKVGVGDDVPVICVAGDGGFMFTASELITAVQYNIQVVFLVVRDNAFGNVKRILKEHYDNKVICADLTNPDFVKLAEAYGMPGRRANSADSLRTALKESLQESGPALIEYEAGEFPSPWHLHMRKPNRG